MADGPVTEIKPHEQALWIVVLRRTLDDESTKTLVDDVQTAAAARYAVPIILDLSKVKFAPSVALGALLTLSKSFRMERRRIVLIGIDARLRETIRVTRLHEMLEIHETVDQALSAPPPAR